MAVPAAAPPDLVREELARLMDSEAMRRAPSHARLLRYLVERRIAGDATALRETSIALEVFRRDPATYDPRADPIVRVAVGRLRERLDAHYAHYDAPPKLRIVLPRGGYAPEFVPLPGAPEARAGLAVLATRNLTGRADLDPLASAFGDLLADRLSRAGVPRVVARTSTDDAQAASREPRAIGARLGVPWLVDSTLAVEPRDGLRLSTRLVAAEGDVRWVETAVSIAGDVHRLVDRMLDAATLRVLETLPSGARSRAPAHTRTPASDATRTVLERVRLLLLQRTVPATDEAIALAERAAEEHPASADAWATLASGLYSRLSFHDRDPAPTADRAEEAATRALAIDPDEPVALRTLAILAGKRHGDFARAQELFVRALAAMPHYTSARINYAELLTLAGHEDVSGVQLALARVHDPLSPSVHMARAVCLGLQRRYAEADEAWSMCRAAGETSLWLAAGEGMNALAAGRLDEAESKLKEADARMPDQPGLLLRLACVHAAKGEHGRARAIERDCAKRFRWHSPAQLATPAAWRRDRGTTLALLAEALDRRDVALLGATMDPAFDWLAGDAVFEKLKRRSPIWAGRAT
jgi:tetratricopeptide (TPR) repeat protein/TolB-like protein